MQVTTLPPTGSAAKARHAYFDPTAGAETPGRFDAPLPKPEPDKRARPVSYDPTAGAEAAQDTHPVEAGDMSFWDLVDIVNPLQHLPIVGTLYRHVTGDKIAGPARIIGGAIFGGPAGLLAGIAETLFEQTSGGDVGTQLAQLVTGKPETNGVALQTAAAQRAEVASAPAPSTRTASVEAVGGAKNSAAPAAAEIGAESGAKVAASAAVADVSKADSAAKAAGPSALFQSLQKPTKGAPTGPTGPVIEIRPQREQAQPVDPRLLMAAGASNPAPQAQGASAALPQQLVADMMMGALDKYAKMKQTGETPARGIDKTL